MRLASIPLQIANVAVVLLPPAVFLSLRSRLPDRVPMHFGLDGQPNRFASPDELWVLFFVMGFLYGLLWLVLYSTATEKKVAPPEAKERFEALETERRLRVVRLTEGSILVANAVMGTVSISIVIGSLPGGADLLRWGPVAAVALAVVGLATVLGIGVPGLSRIEKAQRALPGGEALLPPVERWRVGGLIYYAPDDPAVFVPKRFGIGYTLNFARWGAWLFFVAILGVAFVPILLVSLLG